MKLEFTDEDKEMFRAMIRDEVSKLAVPKPLEPKFYTREEACKLLKITLPTLHAWKKKELIRCKKIENRVLIEEAEINRLMASRKFSS